MEWEIQNLDLTTGVYVWVLQYSNPNNKEVIRKEGTVTLIR
jgi:hypothetical protein